MVYEAGRLLGRNVGTSLLSFIADAREGARVTLQRGREGFSIQITEAVERSSQEAIDRDEIKAWQEKLAALGRRASQ